MKDFIAINVDPKFGCFFFKNDTPNFIFIGQIEDQIDAEAAAKLHKTELSKMASEYRDFVGRTRSNKELQKDFKMRYFAEKLCVY